jgi:iron complex outermembrane recepter protein
MNLKITAVLFGTASVFAFAVGAHEAVAQTTQLPPVTVDAPKGRTVTAMAKPGNQARRSSAARRNSGARGAGTAASGQGGSNNTATRETATGPVNGYVATRSATGTKTDTPLLVTPQSISVVTADQIRDTGAQTVGQALSYSAGVQTQPFGFDARYDQFLIRGFTANQFGQYQDGLRQGNGTFAYYGNEPYGLERIEVMRGPSSVLYGANEAGGMVNMVSKMPLERMLNEVGLDIGNFDRYQGRFDFSGPVKGNDNILYRFTGLFRDSGTQVLGAPDDRYFFAPSVTLKISDDTRITFLSQFEKNRTSMWPYYLRLPTVGVTNIRLGDPSFDALTQTQESVGYRFEHDFNNSATFRQNVRVGHVDWQGEFVDAASLTGNTLNRYAGLFREALTTANADNQLELKLATGPVAHTVLTGVDYFWQSAGFNQALSATAPSLNLLNPVYGAGTVGTFSPINATYQTLSQLGIYAQDQMVWGGWHLTLGGRQDFAELASTNELSTAKTFGVKTESDPNKFTGRAGLLYLFDNGVAPYVNYATSFLPQTGVSAASRGSQPFAPTTGESFEGGVKFQPKGWNSYVTAALFDMTKNNVLTTDPLNTGFSVQTGQIRSRGVELEAVASLSNGLKGIASYSYTDARVTASNGTDLGKIPIAVPNNMAAIWADYTTPSGPLAGLGGGLGLRYTGRTWADTINTIRNPEIYALDAAVHYEYQIYRFEVNARNLLDQRVGICNAGSCTFSLGRTILGSMTVRW